MEQLPSGTALLVCYRVNCTLVVHPPWASHVIILLKELNSQWVVHGETCPSFPGVNYTDVDMPGNPACVDNDATLS